MDFSVLKSEEKIKPFTNYIGPSQQKFSPTSPFNKEAELKNEILFKENQTLIEYPKEKSYNNVNVPIESRFSSYDINLKLGDKTGQAARSNENLMGEKGVKINLTDIIFKNENEFTSQDICKICELSLSKLSGDKKNWSAFLYFFMLIFIKSAICGLTVCKTCSSRKVNENRVCDLCFLKVKSAAVKNIFSGSKILLFLKSQKLEEKIS